MGVAKGLVTALSRGLIGYQQGTRLGREEERARGQEESDRAVQARRQILEERLLNERLTDISSTREVAGTKLRQTSEAAARLRQDPRYKALHGLPDEDLVGAAAEVATHPERRQRPDATGRTGAGGVDERAVVNMANRLFENDEYPTWDEAYSEALRRMQSAGRLRGLDPGKQTHDARRPIDVPDTVRSYIAGQNRGPTRTKSPAQWVSEVRTEHPDWSPEQIADEARRRAGR